MSAKKDPWYVTERSEALAGLLLTNREDVSVRREQKRDSGIDFLVEIGTGNLQSARFFVVQVKGTTSSNPKDWMRDVKQLFPRSGIHTYLPTCVFVVNVRDNTAYYAWAAEPKAEAKSAVLKFYEKGDFRPLDAAAVDSIVDQVKAYYRELPKQLMPT